MPERSFGPRGSAPFLCLPHLLEHHARRIPDAPAILAPERAPLTYGRLYQHVDEMEGRLRAMGITRNDRVAVVLPNETMEVPCVVPKCDPVRVTLVPTNPEVGLRLLITGAVEEVESKPKMSRVLEVPTKTSPLAMVGTVNFA